MRKNYKVKKQVSKKDISKLEKEDARLWKKIEKDYRRIRSEIVKERYPYLFN